VHRRPREAADHLDQILDIALGGERIVRRQRIRSAESALIDAQHRIATRKMRHPRVSGFAACGEAVQLLKQAMSRSEQPRPMW
jgi:hypothetical protein